MNTFGRVYHLDSAGLSQTSEMRIFVRENAVKLWNFLGSSAVFLRVQGPPGIGKSLIAWNWAYHSAVKMNKSVFWMHVFDKQIYGHCVELRGSGLISIFVKNYQVYSYQAVDADILIFDGVREDMRLFLEAEASVWVKQNLERKVIFVGSEQVSFLNEDSPEMPAFQAFSWTIEEYRDAIQDDQFFAQIQTKFVFDDEQNPDREKIVVKKFSLAGGCARWMFGLSDEVIEGRIRYYVDQVHDVAALFQRQVGSASPNTVNHILAHYESGSQIISEYAAYLLARNFEERFVESFRNSRMAQNPAFDGWLFEFEFLTQLKLSARHRRQLELDGEKWDVPNLLEFFEPGDLTSKKINIGDWLIPTRWNQGCYDFLQLNEKSLRVVQVTRASSHSIKVKYVQDLIAVLGSKGFEITSIDFVMVLPSDQVNDFQVSSCKVEGSLRKWGWRQENLCTVDFQQTGRH